MRVARPATRVLLGVMLLSALASSAVMWLTRDPTARFAERHSRLVAVETLEEREEGGDSLRVVRLVAESGLHAELGLRWPAQAAAAGTGRPVILILGGPRTGRAALDRVGPSRGTVVAALAYPFDGDPGAKGLAVVREVPAARRAILDTPPAILLALDHLLSRGDVDHDRVELVGVSFGAPFACIAGALDPRVTRVWSLHGAADPYALIEHGLRRRIPFAPARHLVTWIAYIAINGPRLAPERWVARIAPRPFMMVNAEGDERLPRATVELLYASAREPKSLSWMAGEHVTSRRSAVIEGLVNRVLDGVFADSAAAPRP